MTSNFYVLPTTFTNKNHFDDLRKFVADSSLNYIPLTAGIPESYAYCLLLSSTPSGCLMSVNAIFRMFYTLRTFFARMETIELIEQYQYYTFNFIVLVDATVVTPGLVSWFCSTYSRVRCLVAVHGTTLTRQKELPFNVVYQHGLGYYHCRTNALLWSLIRSRPHGLLLILPHHPKACYNYYQIREWFMRSAYITFCPGFNPSDIYHRRYAYPLPGFSRAAFLQLLFFLRECIRTFIIK